MRIYGHRGLRSDHLTENTAAAARAALTAGADGVEVDLRLTADDSLVACHDADLQRLTGVPVRLRTTPGPAIDAVRLPCGAPLARLRDLVAVSLGATLIVELKHDPEVPCAEQRLAGALVRELRGLRAVGMLPRLTVSSFHPGTLAAVTALRSRDLPLRTALLGGRSVPLRKLTTSAQEHGFDAIHPHAATALDDPSGVRHAQVRGLEVVLWTVNRPHQVRAAHRLGVDGIITDGPALARRALTGAPARSRPVLPVPVVPALPRARAHDRRAPALP